MREIGVGLLGFGTVGAGVVEGLQGNAELIAARLGARPVVRRIADVDLDKDRGVAVDRSILTRDAMAVIQDPAVDVVVELIGGTGVAKSFVTKALELGKPVVTANKALLAKHGRELFDLAERKGVDLYFSASVGGGIPIIRSLREGLSANRIESIYGILNGTCNYILTRMEQDGIPFPEALAEAQAAGYAEMDPSLDIDGHDAAHKIVILASLAYGTYLPLESVYVEGIRNLAINDIRYAAELGYRIRLLAVAKLTGAAEPGKPDVADEVEVRVEPALVSVRHMLASVCGVFNAVMVHGNLVGDTLYYGRGAGRKPTASTVIGDVIDVCRNLLSNSPRRLPAIPGAGRAVRIRGMGEIESRYYLRLSLLDRPGVLARITTTLGEHGISIASVLQKETRVGGFVPVVIVTHSCRENELGVALGRIDAMDGVEGDTVCLRIEE